MGKKSGTLIVFAVLAAVCILLLLLQHITLFAPVRSGISIITSPIQQLFYTTFVQQHETQRIQAVTEENAQLKKLLVEQKKLQSENNALKDQFKINKPYNIVLLPAYVIGAPGFIPGVSPPEFLVIDGGGDEGVKRNQAVVVKDTLIGKISHVSETRSVVSLLTSPNTSFTAKTLQTNATGVVTGSGGALTFEKVLLSQNLKKGDIVVTKGDSDKDGNGIPPDLVVGEITAIDKKPSALFQTAKIKQSIDSTTVSVVFVLIDQ